MLFVPGRVFCGLILASFFILLFLLKRVDAFSDLSAKFTSYVARFGE
jgi:hypothetical protein